MTMLIRQLVAIAALPFTITILVPMAILRRNRFEAAMPNGILEISTIILGVVALFAGVVLFAACVFQFWTRGRGTLAPWDPPRRFVADGPYRYVRNPMITGVILILIGEAAILRSSPLAQWLAVFVVINMIYIPLLEEPMLRARFGSAYEDYLRAVPRFIPRLRPWYPRASA
jgi:protein-S-isoprenylcysteine O-methyltransferase Ste14